MQAAAGMCAAAARRPRAAATEQHQQRHHPSTLWHAQHLVGRFPTDMWGVQATTPAPAVQLLVVPGNPGAAAFYRCFAQQLHAAFGGAADVLAVSHVGHDTCDLSRGGVWGLEEQVQHKLQLLAEVVLARGTARPPTIILAHSIGSWIMLQVRRAVVHTHSVVGRATHVPCGSRPPCDMSAHARCSSVGVGVCRHCSSCSSSRVRAASSCQACSRCACSRLWHRAVAAAGTRGKGEAKLSMLLQRHGSWCARRSSC
jgi:hypothetical protein